jgi:hypothetical protein
VGGSVPRGTVDCILPAIVIANSERQQLLQQLGRRISLHVGNARHLLYDLAKAESRALSLSSVAD